MVGERAAASGPEFRGQVMDTDHREPEEQPVPDAARCRECGGAIVKTSGNLHAIGYLAEDQYLFCEDCGQKQTHGVPDGEADEYFWHDLVCESCGEWGRTHRINVDFRRERVGLVMKCPECYYVWQVGRAVGDACAIVGWPMTTGELGEGTPWLVDGRIRPQDDEGAAYVVRERASASMRSNDD